MNNNKNKLMHHSGYSSSPIVIRKERSDANHITTESSQNLKPSAPFLRIIALYCLLLSFPIIVKANTISNNNTTLEISSDQQYRRRLTYSANQVFTYAVPALQPFTFIVPYGVTSIYVEAIGAASGTAAGGTQGLGAKVTSILSVVPGTTLYIYIGGKGTDGSGDGSTTGAGGFNGGSNGNGGGGGGGATDIRNGTGTINNRLLVAAGGGGPYYTCTSANGGNGGSPNGVTGTVGTCVNGAGGGGATQSYGGTNSHGQCSALCAGSFGQGGITGNGGGGGGGGGYYGGAVGYGGGAGGGGSSYSIGIGTTYPTPLTNTGDGSLTIFYNPQPTLFPTMMPSMPTSQPSGQPSRQPSRQPSSKPSRLPSGQPSRKPSFQPSSQPSRHPSGQPTIQPSSQPSFQPSLKPLSFDNMHSIIQQFSYATSGQPFTYVVPYGVTSLYVEATGAASGTGDGGTQGLGAKVTSILSVIPGTTLYLYIGGKGVNVPAVSPSGTYAGGFNGGGNGWNGAGGGGATDIRDGTGTIINRLLVAAGGGGPYFKCSPSNGGNGGSPNGVAGTHGSGCGGGVGGGEATQSAGGINSDGSCGASCHGTLGQGGDTYNAGGGGGGGYYGGAGGYGGGAGGGGSSYSVGSGTTYPTPLTNTGDGSLTIFYDLLPTCAPTFAPTYQPSKPTSQPSSQPANSPSRQPTSQPSRTPSVQPSRRPSCQPSIGPTRQPSRNPSYLPTKQPSNQPTTQPSQYPLVQPTSPPSSTPSTAPTMEPTIQPSIQPTTQPSQDPVTQPTNQPSTTPSRQPSTKPSTQPSGQPSRQPSQQPASLPSNQPTTRPSQHPSAQPTIQPSTAPSRLSTTTPSTQPSKRPSAQPSQQPASMPSNQPTSQPSTTPSRLPTTKPSRQPSDQPSLQPVTLPSMQPSSQPINHPSQHPSAQPTSQPTVPPSRLPATYLSTQSSGQPSRQPSQRPTSQPSSLPLVQPSFHPSGHPSCQPLVCPSALPSKQPSVSLSMRPTSQPSRQPSGQPSLQPMRKLTGQPTSLPSVQPVSTPSTQPSSVPSFMRPTSMPLVTPSGQPPDVSNQLTGSPTMISVKPTLMPISVVYEGGNVTNFKIVLPFMFTNPVYGDGKFDVFVSRINAGRSLLIFGNKEDSHTSFVGYDHLEMSPAISYDYSGRSVSNVGDVNGDGYYDLIIGVPYSSKCYVVFGTSEGFVDMIDGFTVYGADRSDLTGWSVSAAGDVNNDSYADLIIGAPSAEHSRSGAVYVLYGKVVHSDIDLAQLSAEDGFVVYGANEQDSLGISVSRAGDVNGDGYNDIVFGALRMSEFFAGGVYILFGGNKSDNIVFLKELTVSIGFFIEGLPWSWFGYSVGRAGDVNGDGFDDILIGSAPRKVFLGTPVSYIIYGKRDGTFVNGVETLVTSAGMKIVGGGVVVNGVDDVNGDGLDDVMLIDGVDFSSGGGIFFCIPRMFPQLNLIPSVRPSMLPSNAPSKAPSVNPTFIPTRPTAVPTIAPTGPTFRPSMAPTQPTSAPSTRPTAPSLAPSVCLTITPRVTPSVMPSLNPSKSQSVLPSVVTKTPSMIPTVIATWSPTRYPVVRPSMMPSNYSEPPVANITYIVKYINQGGQYARDHNNTQYIINSTSDVTIAGNGGGVVMFTVLPNKNTKLRIIHFNLTTDVIDLKAFSDIHFMNHLFRNFNRHLRVFTAVNYSVEISLGSGQSILIANISRYYLDEDNFIFAMKQSVPTVEHTNNNLGPRIAFCIVSGALGLFLVYKAGEQLCEYLHTQRLIARVTDWDSDIVRKNPTYLSFHINDSDRSIFSDISKESEDDYSDITPESKDSTVYESPRHSAVGESKSDSDSGFSGTVSSFHGYGNVSSQTSPVVGFNGEINPFNSPQLNDSSTIAIHNEMICGVWQETLVQWQADSTHNRNQYTMLGFDLPNYYVSYNTECVEHFALQQQQHHHDKVEAENGTNLQDWCRDVQVLNGNYCNNWSNNQEHFYNSTK